MRRSLNYRCNVKVSIGPYPRGDKERKITVKIDGYDVWNADHTLALIIHPLLVKVKESKPGAPFVHDEDVPDHLKASNATSEKIDLFDTDEFWHQRWEYVIDEMIWAFAQIIDDNEEPNYDGTKGKWIEYDNRCQNGYRLFGKYLRALWT